MGAAQAPDRKLENRLVKLALAGDATGFEELYRLYARRIHRVCLRMVGDAAQAEDLTQEVFVLAYRRLATFRQESRFSTWLHAIAVNTVLMFFRKRGSAPQEYSLEPYIRGDDEEAHRIEREIYGRPDEALRMTADRLTLQRAIADLPEGYRMMVILHDIQGYQHEEIAEMLGCTVGNTKSQLHKARLKLRAAVHQPLKGSKPVRAAEWLSAAA